MNLRLIHSLTGLFLLAMLALVVVSIVSLPRIRTLFGRSIEARTFLPEAYVAAGDPVYFRGYRVGGVVRVVPHLGDEARWEAPFEAVFALETDFGDVVTTAYEATVEVGALGALTGSKLVLIAPPADAAPPEVGVALADWDRDASPVLAFRRPSALLDQVTDRVESLLDTLVPQVEAIVADVATITGRLADERGPLFATLGDVQRMTEALAASLADPEGDLRRTLADARSIVASIEAGEGTVGGLLKPSPLSARVQELTDSAAGAAGGADELLGRVNTVMADVQEATRSLPAIVRDLERAIGRLDTASRTLPGLAEEVRRALDQVNVLLDAAQRLPLIGSRVTPPEPADPLVLPALTSPPAGAGR